MRIKVRTIPNAKKNECAGAYAEAVKIKVAAQAVDGKANEELIKFLAKTLDIPRKSIEIISGATSRDKVLELPDNTDISKLL